MTKKTTLISVTFLALLFSCKPDRGDQGPMGIQGEKGDPGEDGNANVIYSEWKSAEWDIIGNSSGAIQIGWYDQFSDIITTDILNTGVFYIYGKTQTLAYNGETEEVFLKEIYTRDVGSTGYKKIADSTGVQYDDYVTTVVYFNNNYDIEGIDFDGSTFITGWQASPTPAADTIPALKGLSAEEIIEIYAKDLHQFRVIALKGNVSARVKAMNWNDYESVVRELGIPK
ncbi:MAG: hypothetical protein NXI00_02205 [Cytophagales bacterium]|nr:hypothetical protein [Cytophagales bacterium]